jgi:hypothetical protein
MKVIKNIEGKDLSFQFEGWEYHFESGKLVQVEDGLYNYLKETVPLAFKFEPKLKKKAVVVKVPRVKFAPKFPGSRFGIKSTDVAKGPDGLPLSGSTDRDGVGWYGEGLQVDSV